ncbi:hypothetical protein L915_15612 [Phytophthora nicotianae]|uniref:Uncharacterized protein n=1 Tax=Phytophthora nicotianae TaxID=4792 RepID=W2IBZ3_PHYNI|nr:hypothetical protein L915_15612 [Phytophthora nicotianae]ETL31769.1 hypothetical protein L916_15505 [Phytophthora nicotianae]
MRDRRLHANIEPHEQCDRLHRAYASHLIIIFFSVTV